MRRVLAFTANRAEYGLYFPILRAITEHPELELELVVSGSHLSEEYGRTIEEIERDGFTPAGKIPLPEGGDDGATMARSAGEAIRALADRYADSTPDLSLVYGDRVEALSCAVACVYLGIAIAHVSGGDRTGSGTADNSVRDAITKLSHLHFPSSDVARARILGLGEEEWRIHNFGSPAVDNLLEAETAPPEELASDLDLDLRQPILVFTQHALTLEAEDAGRQVRAALDALEELGIQTVVTYPNNDAGGRRIIAEIEKRRNVPHFRIRTSLGRRKYLGLLRIASAVVGNSSSGLLETPILGVPAVNIGTRQDNRIRAENVMDVGYDKEEIGAAVRKAVYDGAFRKRARHCHNPFGTGGTGPRIAACLAEVELGNRLLLKEMVF